mgnify:CR=1 FL=1
MSMWARAAQFAPFAAIAGHDDAIREEGRLTDEWSDLSDSANEELNRKIELLISKLSEHTNVTICYFLPDNRKSGGSYQTTSGQVRRIDTQDRIIELTDGKKISIDTIRDLNYTTKER